ncbi:AAA family ATPase [Flavobacterium endoglycinae]|uniref:AAA family ATPase n=1 Tax=Flavobacterium endoglycinae TaxID=2816357 RepID=A0ABX7QGG9_9FLAO|nr:AAA family ATPase [Flavobacterium endoglycinae]QSW89573.1 AAA family ATPase [Flavobacterium endoglycinae]
MEKLIVKNFGPIKEAEINLTKYVVFIGDTSTGKSVLAKLISIFRDSFVILSLTESIKINIKTELKRYNINFDINSSEIKYIDEDVILCELVGDDIVLKDEDLKNNNLKAVKTKLDKLTNDSFFSKLIDFNKENFFKFSINHYLKNRNSTYVPAERILFSLVGNSLSGLLANNVALPECYKDFAAKYEVARDEIREASYQSFNLDYSYDKGIDEVLVNNAKVLLSEASSGIQSLIPLLLVIDYEIKINDVDFNYNKGLIVEEPELNLFPIKQKKLIDHLILKVSNTKHKIIMTTHSPYILSSLDTLILAKNTFDEHPDLKEEINSIVSENKWIDYDDISVYEVRNDGKVYSIKNEEFRSIDTNAIDAVSDIISEEFDKLTELRYAQ